jgi:hypothetical protein
MGSPGKMGGNMPQPQGMPSSMNNMDMGNMNNQFSNMMMPNQMGFQNQGMYMDPNLHNILMGNSGFEGQQFSQNMMGNNQFMQPQQFNNMMQIPAPSCSLKFPQVHTNPDGSL